MPRKAAVKVVAPKEPVVEETPDAVIEDVWTQVEDTPDTPSAEAEGYADAVGFPSFSEVVFSDVKIVEYLLDSLDLRNQDVNAYRREQAQRQIQELLADGYTLLSSAGGAHGNRTLFVFTLAK